MIRQPETLSVEIADAYVGAGMYREALAVLNGLVRHDTLNNADLWFRQARCYFELEELQDAKIQCEKVLRQHPGDQDCTLLLSQVYEAIGDVEQAITLARDIIPHGDGSDLENEDMEERQEMSVDLGSSEERLRPDSIK